MTITRAIGEGNGQFNLPPVWNTIFRYIHDNHPYSNQNLTLLNMQQIGKISNYFGISLPAATHPSGSAR